MRRIPLLLAPWVALFAALSAQGSTEWPAGIDIDRVEQGTVIFKTPDGQSIPKPLKTRLYDLKYLGSLLAPEGGVPYLVLSGKPCQSCSADKAVYLIRADGSRSTHFVHPGRVVDPKSHAVLLDSRAFFGKCIGTAEDVYVVFQREKVDRRSRLQSSVFVATPGKDLIHEKLYERHLPRIDATLKRVRAKNCVEVNGSNRMMLTKPLDLNPRRGDDKDDDAADDEAPKENQTATDLPSPQD